MDLLGGCDVTLIDLRGIILLLSIMHSHVMKDINV